MAKKDKEISVTRGAAPSSSLVAFDDLDRWFDDFLSRRWPRPFQGRLPEWSESDLFVGENLPNVDIIDHDSEIEIQAALPGVKKEDLDVSIGESTVTIRASSQKEDKEETKQYYRQEISRGEFQRTLSLPANVDSDKAKASFKDGILAITLPKLEKSKRKSIEIK